MILLYNLINICNRTSYLTQYKALKISELIRLEIHGPEQELEKLREPLAELKPQFFVLKYGFRR